MKAMKLPVSQMKEGENHYLFDYSQDSSQDSAHSAWLRDVVEHVKQVGLAVTGPLKVELNFTKFEPDYFLRGDIGFSLIQDCSRCAEPLERSIAHHFELALSQAADHSQPEVKAEENSDEIDTVFFQGHDIPLAPLIEEQMVLSVPYRFLCQEGCRGLCQNCGINLNESSCACVKKSADGPFSILKKLKS